MKYKLLILTTCLMLNYEFYSQINGSKWETYFEKSGYLATPDYQETIKYFKNIADNTPYTKIFVFGKSPHGRDLYCIIASKDKLFSVDEVKKSSKPVLMIMNGIHAGEIEGKDACMLLLRDILITKEESGLLDNCVLMIIPVFNVDGHERRSPYNRINQNGPAEMGSPIPPPTMHAFVPFSGIGNVLPRGPSNWTSSSDSRPQSSAVPCPFTRIRN